MPITGPDGKDEPKPRGVEHYTFKGNTMKKLLLMIAVSGFLMGCAEQGDMSSPPATPPDTNAEPDAVEPVEPVE